LSKKVPGFRNWQRKSKGRAYLRWSFSICGLKPDTSHNHRDQTHSRATDAKANRFAVVDKGQGSVWLTPRSSPRPATTEVIDRNNHPTSYAYDKNNLLTMMTDPFFRIHVRAVAKGALAPLQASERLKLLGITTRVAQRLFLRQAVHEDVLATKEGGITPGDEQQLLVASRELAKAFEHLNQDDVPGKDPANPSNTPRASIRIT
jgi:YD repeat-containing protein